MSRLLAILGATATGKSSLAMEVAGATGAEIVSADALQVYRGLDIGTAKPSAEDRARVPHHLVDILDPAQRFSAGEFARRALAAVAEIHGRGKAAIVAGGSGLYLRALFSGLAEIPAAPPELRRELTARLRGEGAAGLRSELEALDPETSRRLAPADVHRTVRALEVVHATGRPLSSWLRDGPSSGALPPCAKLGLTLPRAVLYDRIEERVHAMVERGWPEEVSGLLAAGIATDAPALQAIGYSDWIRHLQSEVDRETTIAEIVRATRRYAKRQETWFRRERGVEWIDARERARLVSEARVRLEG